jgi:signal transduction histidine kinase
MIVPERRRMSRKRILESLGRIELFENLRPQTLARIVRACSTVTLGDGQLLFPHGAAGDCFYIVLAGQVEVFRGERVIATIGPYDCVGELALLDAAPRSAAVRSVGTTALLQVPRETFDTYLRAEPEAMAAIMRTIGQRLRRTLDDTQAAYEQVSMLVHDMLNMLNAFSGAESVLDTLAAGDDNRWFLEQILKTQRTLETMMRAALKRSSGDTTPYEKRPARLDELVHECLEHDIALHPDLDRIFVRVEVETPLAALACNAIDVRRVIANLIINAAQALRDDSEVVVRLRQTAETMTLTVADRGVGVPEHLKAWIFEPHFTTKPGGNGLGLSSCRDIVERLHGGRLTCQSTYGVGSTFTCELPVGDTAIAALPHANAEEHRVPEAQIAVN